MGANAGPAGIGHRRGSASGRGTFGDTGGSWLRNELPCSLVFVAASDAVSAEFIEAVEHEFPQLDIQMVSQLSEIDVEFRHPVALFLVDSSLLANLDAMMRRYARRHPRAAAAVVFEDMDGAMSNLALIFRSDRARGVLPMNLTMDVWLAALRLLLCGGEYVPTSLLKACPRNCTLFKALPPDDSIEAPGSDHTGSAADDVVHELTLREMEVAELMARGAQNKVIAAGLGLSENTVKIHVGSVIRKLRASNRTEAAANFLRALGQRPGEGR
jgi:DNA-binding NarL/FixJ family response regulator